MTSRMKALFFTGYGPPAARLSVLDAELPVAAAHEIVVEIRAAALNPHDFKTVRGEFKRWNSTTFPAQIGGDVSGVVVSVGRDVVRFRPGDRVFGVIRGAIAQYGKGAEDSFALMPAMASFTEMASLPVVGLTTIQAFQRAQLSADDRILIHAGSGGVGTFAIQYARSKGAFVFTTTSSANLTLVRSLGANVAIDYRAQNYLDEVTALDVVYDTLGGEYAFDAFKVTRPGGRIVGILPAELNKAFAVEIGLPRAMQLAFSLLPGRVSKLERQHKASYRFVYVQTNHCADHLQELAGLVEQGHVRAVVDRVYPLAQSIEAFEYLEAGHARGKVLIDPTSKAATINPPSELR